jgi:hypothetical protein
MSGRRSLQRLAIAALLILPLSAHALKDLHVVALFKNRVMVEIDGRRHLLSSGETSPEGVTLVSADRTAVRARRRPGPEPAARRCASTAIPRACLKPSAVSMACRSVFWSTPAPRR